MSVIEAIQAVPKFHYEDVVIPVRATSNHQFDLVVGCDLSGRYLVAVKWPNERRHGKWMLFVDFAETNFVANWLDTLVLGAAA